MLDRCKNFFDITADGYQKSFEFVALDELRIVRVIRFVQIFEPKLIVTNLDTKLTFSLQKF